MVLGRFFDGQSLPRLRTGRGLLIAGNRPLGETRFAVSTMRWVKPAFDRHGFGRIVSQSSPGPMGMGLDRGAESRRPAACCQCQPGRGKESV